MPDHLHPYPPKDSSTRHCGNYLPTSYVRASGSSSSDPVYRACAPEIDIKPAGSTASSSITGHLSGSQDSRCQFVVQDFGGQTSQASQQTGWQGAINSGVAAETGVPHVLHHSSDLDCLPSPSDLIQLHEPLHQSPGMFYQARNFIVKGTFVDGNVTYNDTFSNQFMDKLLEKTIPGAEFDSSDRDPPPRCHPGTRLAVLERCLYFVHNCDGMKKMRWIFGAAGVGKSAIMQNVAESPDLAVSYQGSIFFSINGCHDGTKAVITLSYQFAAKSKSYRQVIEREIRRDPSLLRSSIAKQFNKLIVEPLILDPQLKSSNRILIIIDGLDECADTRTQLELLRLISDICITHPSSPLVWLIASRPESHIVSFFSRRDVIPVYEKEEILVDTDEARAEVERFLRDKLMEIKEAYSLDPQWPQERDIWRLASAAGGFFAYANTVIKYIGDLIVGSPASQLSDVLDAIDDHLMSDIPREDHPMALLDALYDRILSNVHPKVMVNTRKLLLALSSQWDFALTDDRGNFVVLCNWLGMTPDEAYAALNHLRSVLYAPQRDQAHKEALGPFHKSFTDYISDLTRSKFARDNRGEARQLAAQCALRILKEAPDGMNLNHVNNPFRYGSLMRGPGMGNNISLTWVVNEVDGWNDDATRLMLYKLAMGEVVAGIKCGDPLFKSEFCIRFLTTRFRTFKYPAFSYDELCDLVFDESRRVELMTCGILKTMPLKVVEVSNLYRDTEARLLIRSPAISAANSTDQWKPSYQHRREGDCGEGKWTTTFDMQYCNPYFQRMTHQMTKMKIESPNHTLTILFTSTIQHCVEFKFVDPEDGVSEWMYWFWIEFSYKDHQKYIWEYGMMYD